MGTIQWPQIGVGAVVTRNDKVLLVLRGKAPNIGLWAIPGGRLRAGETLQQAAEREIMEETGVHIHAGELIYNTEYIERDKGGAVAYHYVILDLEGRYIKGEPKAGDDAVDARWIAFSDLQEMPVTESTIVALKQLFPEQFQ